MTRVAVISANLGAYDPHVDWVPQVVDEDVSLTFHRFTDANFPPRPLAMTSRLQAGIPKMFGWQLRPGHDVYIWIDASRGLLRGDSVTWFLEHLEPGVELVLFRHPERKTIKAEYEFMKRRMVRPRESYLTSRYSGEWLDEQYLAIATDATYVDDTLYASTAFAYRPTGAVQRMMAHWWMHKSRYLLHDQLALPYCVAKAGCAVRVLEDNVYTCAHLPFTRGKR
jgi:hypothetical protein